MKTHQHMCAYAESRRTQQRSGPEVVHPFWTSRWFHHTRNCSAADDKQPVARQLVLVCTMPSLIQTRDTR